MRILHGPILILLMLLLSACQRYSRSPLDLRSHHAAVEARGLSGEEVIEYAQHLARPPRTIAYDPSDGLSLQEAEVVALFFNPQLRVARLKANVARVGAAEAGRWQDPELGVDVERIIKSVPEPWVLIGTLSLTLPISGRLGVEKKQANAEMTVAELRALAEERAVVAELRAAWAGWSASRERVALTQQLIGEFKQAVERAERLREAGELDPIDARLLRLEMVKQLGNLRKYEADTRAGEMQLKTRLGLVPTAKITLVSTLLMPPAESLTEADLPAVLTANPRVKVARAEYEVAERTLELEVRRQYPDLKLGGGYGTDEGDDRVVFGASLPLPLLNANRRAIAEAQANREVARAAAEALYEQLLGDASATQVRLEVAEDRVQYVEKELAPLADRQVEDAQRLAKVGELNALVLLEALRDAYEAKIEVLDARLDLALARSRFELLVEGTSAIPTTAPTTPPAMGTALPTTTTQEVQP
jgi:outer membrane protein, heavy metal efflux system